MTTMFKLMTLSQEVLDEIPSMKKHFDLTDPDLPHDWVSLLPIYLSIMQLRYLIATAPPPQHPKTGYL